MSAAERSMLQYPYADADEHGNLRIATLPPIARPAGSVGRAADALVRETLTDLLRGATVRVWA